MRPTAPRPFVAGEKIACPDFLPREKSATSPMISIEKIPPLSAVALRVMEMDPDSPDSDVTAMEGVIKPDKGVSAELLRIANSALYGRSGKIKTLRDAVALLGLKMVKNLVIMLSTTEMSASLRRPNYRKYLQEFPVIAALLSLDVYRPLGLPELIEEAFVGALLHRIGMSIIALNKPDHYDTLLGFAETGKDSLVDLERQSYRTDQNAVTALVCEAWKLPSDLREPLVKADCSVDDVAGLSDLTRLTIVSAVLAERMLAIRLMRQGDAKFARVLAFYEQPPDALDRFGPRYLPVLQEHPFYKQAVGG